MTDRAPPRGVLAMSDAELSAFIRDIGITFPVLTPEAKAEAQRENEYLEAHESGAVREAFESGAIWRKKPGPEAKREEEYRRLRLECLRDFPDDGKSARIRFRVLSRLNPRYARNVWSRLSRGAKK
jgi:hypothetical protein